MNKTEEIELSLNFNVCEINLSIKEISLQEFKGLTSEEIKDLYVDIFDDRTAYPVVKRSQLSNPSPEKLLKHFLSDTSIAKNVTLNHEWKSNIKDNVLIMVSYIYDDVDWESENIETKDLNFEFNEIFPDYFIFTNPWFSSRRASPISGEAKYEISIATSDKVFSRTIKKNFEDPEEYNWIIDNNSVIFIDEDETIKNNGGLKNMIDTQQNDILPRSDDASDDYFLIKLITGADISNYSNKDALKFVANITSDTINALAAEDMHGRFVILLKNTTNNYVKNPDLIVDLGLIDNYETITSDEILEKIGEYDSKYFDQNDELEVNLLLEKYDYESKLWDNSLYIVAEAFDDSCKKNDEDEFKPRIEVIGPWNSRIIFNQYAKGDAADGWGDEPDSGNMDCVISDDFMKLNNSENSKNENQNYYTQQNFVEYVFNKYWKRG